MRIFLPILSVFMMFSAAAAEEGAKPFIYDDHGRRDPLWRLVSPNGAILNYETEFLITDLSLEGIVAGADGRNFAIINGRVLGADDTIGRFAVERIEEDFVILRKGRQKFELKLKKEE